MATDGRYVANEAKFKDYTYRALGVRFLDRTAFENFYTFLSGPSKKDEFLRVASFYLFLVKEGDWHLSFKDNAPDYLTNSFRVVGIFALIESLSDEQHQDFYEWLGTQDPKTLFPISDPNALLRLNEEYKATYGSIRRCVAFFSRLPQDRQRALQDSIRVNGNPLVSIKQVAEFLYNIRSKFVHEAQLVLELGDDSHLSMKKGKVVEILLPINALLEAFEEGVLAYFGYPPNETGPLPAKQIS